MKNILVIGANSAIAEHCARKWAARGDRLYLVSRNAQKLSRVAADLRLRGAWEVVYYVMDVNEFDGHQPMLDAAEAALGGIDIVLVAHGTLSPQKACERDVARTMEEISTNALSAIALLTRIANRLEAKRAGTIAVISSVAGDRGRASNYVYGSAKAMVTAFTSGLRQRLGKANVAVVTIKPGFVDTPMTADFKKGVLWAEPSQVAVAIVRAIDQRRAEIYVPGFWRYVMFVVRHTPHLFFTRMS